MRIRKAFMALNPQGHIVRAENAIPEVHYRCHHCDCPLLLHTEDRRGKPWFEHDAQAFTEDQLRKCVTSRWWNKKCWNYNSSFAAYSLSWLFSGGTV
ncbi:hypothetical protein QB984_004246 [Salmonella enterica]|nr:hypothetical protein [Salmonella enterica]EKS5918621.1 hypothetical protein [Salmonella enterica]